MTEDFNGRPVARATATGSQALGRADRPVSQGEVVLWFAGVPWDAVNGTDRHLATALSEHGLVVWVDPPTSWTSRPRRGLEIPAVSRPRPGVVRVSTSCPPGVSRPGSRRLARWLVTAHAARVVRSLGGGVATVVVSDPQQHVPRRSGAAVRVYFETDDFVAGAGLLGHSTRYALRCRRVNLRRSDVVLAVTDHLRARLEQEPDAPTVVVTLANGADTHHYRDVDAVAVAAEVALARPMAGLIGQLNDRLDLDALDAVAGTGSRLLLLGPRYDSRPETRARLDALIARPNVQWVDRQPFERLPEFMAALDVGLTPYAVTDFNRGSHPLKTLEYLAAGRGAISTDLPAARALGTDLVTVTGSAAEFAAATVEHLAAPPDPRLVAARRDFAGTHSWQVRAKQLLGICDEVRARRRDGEER